MARSPQFQNAGSLPQVAVWMSLLGVSLAACSAEQTTSLNDQGERRERRSVEARTDSENQIAASTGSDEKNCSFRYQSGAGSARLEWSSDNAAACKAVCESQKPVGMTGICYFKEDPLGADLSLPAVEGLWSITVPQQQEDAQQGSAFVFNDVQQPKAVTEESRAPAAPVGLCELSHTGEGAVAFRETLQTHQAECAEKCGSKLSASGGGIALECAFNGVVFQKVTVGGGLQENASSDAAAPEQCFIESRKRARADLPVATYSSTLEVPDRDSCASDCERQISSDLIGLTCTFADSDTFVQVDMGHSADDAESRSCLTSSTIGTSTSSRSIVTTQSECRALCLERAADEPESLVCQFGP